jgi:phosphate/sulfate permease
VELHAKLEEDFFTKLVNINFKYIEKYYLQTQVQAEKSFRLTLFASVVGLGIICTGIGIMWRGKTTPGYVTTGAGLISEFIAAVFFYLYNRTILKMGQYHQKLVLTQNVSLALKIAEGLPDGEKAKAQAQLVEALSKDVNQLLSRNEPEK